MEDRERVETVIPEPVQETKTLTVMSPKLNIRERPDLQAKIVCVAKQDDELQVTSIVRNGTWAQVHNVAGIKGFAMTKFLEG